MNTFEAQKISASDVAKYIIHFFQECGDPITNLKLQKLLYYVQGWFLGLNGTELFDDEFEAWIHGPVIPGVFQEYKNNRWSPIVIDVVSINLPENIEEHINAVLEVYGGDSGWSLEMRSHKEPPWINARMGIAVDEPSNNIITKDSMKKFFEELASDGN